MINASSNFAKRRILIAGGNGFIGRALIDYLLLQQADVVCLVRDDAKTRVPVPFFNWNNKKRWEKEKFTDVIVLTNTPLNKSFPQESNAIFETHVSAPLFLANWAIKQGVSRFVYFSTGSIYELPKQRETGTIVKLPPNFFVSAKNAAETLLQSFTSHMTIHIVRLFRPYGPSHRDSMINNLIKTLFLEQNLTLTCPDGPMIQPIHLTDVCAVTAALLNQKQASIIDLAGKDRLTLGKFIRTAATLANVEARIQFSNQHSVDDKLVKGSGIKDLDKLIKTPLNDGLKSLIEFIRQS